MNCVARTPQTLRAQQLTYYKRFSAELVTKTASGATESFCLRPYPIRDRQHEKVTSKRGLFFQHLLELLLGQHGDA